MDLNFLRRIALKSADLESEPVTEEELEILRKKLEEIKKSQKESKPPDYSTYPKDKLIKILKDREKEHKKIETFYRNQNEELEAELSDIRELIISLIDERNEIDIELSTTRKQKQELKSQVQYLEIELNKRDQEKTEKIKFYTQQVQEKQLKIELLKTQISDLQMSKLEEKKNLEDKLEKIPDLEKDLEDKTKLIEGLQRDLSGYNKDSFFSEETDKKLQDAVTKLSFIILNSEKKQNLSAEARLLVKQIFGESCSKIIEDTDKYYKELIKTSKSFKGEHSKLSSITDLLIQEFSKLFHWVESQNKLATEKDLQKLSQTFSSDFPRIAEDFKKTINFSKNPERLNHPPGCSSKDQSIVLPKSCPNSLTSEEVEKLKTKIKQQKTEIKELKSELHSAYLTEAQIREEITELKTSISSLKKPSPKQEIMRFLQCQSLMVENLLNQDKKLD